MYHHLMTWRLLPNEKLGLPGNSDVKNGCCIQLFKNGINHFVLFTHLITQDVPSDPIQFANL